MTGLTGITVPENLAYQAEVEAVRKACSDWLWEAARPLIRSCVMARKTAREPVALLLHVDIRGVRVQLHVSLNFHNCRNVEQGWRAMCVEIGHWNQIGWRRVCDTDTGYLKSLYTFDSEKVTGTILFATTEPILIPPAERPAREQSTRTLDRPVRFPGAGDHPG